jgi:hypothetical protein
MSFGGLLASQPAKLPEWATIILAVLLCLGVLSYLCAFAYFCRKDPVQLRSERFAIQQMALSHRLSGDSETGYLQAEGVSIGHAPRTLPSPQAGSEESQ